MDGWDFLLVARQLGRSARECDLRTSISRSYFAAFNGVAGSLSEQGIHLPRGPEAHVALYRCLNGSDHEALEQVAAWLNGLKVERNRADYDMTASPNRVSGAAAAKALERALRLRHAFEAVPIDQVVAAIRDHPDVASRRPPGESHRSEG